MLTFLKKLFGFDTTEVKVEQSVATTAPVVDKQNELVVEHAVPVLTEVIAPAPVATPAKPNKPRNRNNGQRNNPNKKQAGNKPAGNKTAQKPQAKPQPKKAK